MTTGTIINKLKSASKVVVAVIGFALWYLNDHNDIVPVQYRGYVTGAIALLTFLGVYQAPHGSLPSLTALRPSARRSAARKATRDRHPVSGKAKTAPATPNVLHPKASHPGAALDHPAPTKAPTHKPTPTHKPPTGA